jgi:predicted porin
VTLSGSIGTTYQTSVTEGATANSRAGLARSTGAVQLTGTEDLGGGLKAGFRFEERLGTWETVNARATTGTGLNTGNFGSRQSFLTLSGAFGMIKAGRDLDANAQMIGYGNVSGANATAGLDSSKLNAVYYGDVRANSISYTTPTISGFTAFAGLTAADYDALGTAAGATTTAAGNVLCSVPTGTAANTACVNTILAATNPVAASKKQDNPTAFGVTYNQGPLNVGVVRSNYEGSLNIQATTIAANYDFGVAKVGALTQTMSADGKTDRKATIVSVNVPVGAFALQVATGKSSAEANAFSSAFAKEVKHTMVGVQYNLSKRTSAYAIVNNKKVDGAALNDGDYKETGFGIKHAF